MIIKYAVMMIFLLMSCLSISKATHAQEDSLTRKSGKGRVPYFVKISPEKSNCIYVTINTERISTKAKLENVSVEIEFYDLKDKYLGKKIFYLTTEDESLKQGVIHRWKEICHSYSGVSKIRGIGFNYDIYPIGIRPAYPNSFFERNTQAEQTLENYQGEIRDHSYKVRVKP